MKRLEDRLRRIYATLTCRTSDARPQHAAQRPPRPSTHREVTPPHHSSQQHEPAYFTPHQTPRAPPLHEAGGSTWHQRDRMPPPPHEAGGSTWHHQTPFDDGGSGYSYYQQLRQGGPAWPSTYSTIFFLAQYNEHVIDFFHAIGAQAHDTSSGSAFYSDDPDISHTQDLMTQQSYGGALQTQPPLPTQDTQEDMAPHLYGRGHRQPHGPHPRLSPSGRRPRPPARRARTRVVRDDA